MSRQCTLQQYKVYGSLLLAFETYGSDMSYGYYYIVLYYKIVKNDN